MENKYKKAVAVGYTMVGETSDIEDVHLIIPSLERSVTYRAVSRGNESSKLPVCSAVANFMNKNAEALGEPVFVGFSLPEFLMQMGLGCAKAGGVYFSPDLWLSPNRQFGFDLKPILFPESGSSPPAKWFSQLGGQFSGEDKKVFDKAVKGWKPFQDAERDGQISFLLGSLFRIWG